MAVKGSNSTCFVIDYEGKVQKTLTNHGWTSQLTALTASDIDDDGRLEVVCGINRGDNLRVFDPDTGDLKWQHNLGDPVTAIVVYPASAGKLLVAGSQSCYACAFSGQGAKVWLCNLESPVTRFVITDLSGEHERLLLAGCEDGSTWMIDGDGQKRRFLPSLDGRITSLWIGILRAGTEPVVIIDSTNTGLSVWSLQHLL